MHFDDFYNILNIFIHISLTFITFPFIFYDMFPSSSIPKLTRKPKLDNSNLKIKKKVNEEKKETIRIKKPRLRLRSKSYHNPQTLFQHLNQTLKFTQAIKIVSIHLTSRYERDENLYSFISSDL